MAYKSPDIQSAEFCCRFAFYVCECRNKIASSNDYRPRDMGRSDSYGGDITSMTCFHRVFSAFDLFICQGYKKNSLFGLFLNFFHSNIQ